MGNLGLAQFNATEGDCWKSHCPSPCELRASTSLRLTSTACVSFFSNHRRGARVPGGHGPACRTSTRAPRRTAWRNRPVTAFQAVLGSRSNWTAGFRRKPATLHFGIRAAPIRRYNS